MIVIGRKGVDKNVSKGLSLLEDAARLDDPDATFNLAQLYLYTCLCTRLWPCLCTCPHTCLNIPHSTLRSSACTTQHTPARLHACACKHAHRYGANGVTRNFTSGVKHALAAKRIRFWKSDYLLGQVVLAQGSVGPSGRATTCSAR